MVNDPSDRTDNGDVLRTLQSERRELCDWLAALEPADWDIASQCDGWTVRDVVAHLTLSTRETFGDFAGGMLRYRGNFDRMNFVRARNRSRCCSPEELVEQLRSSAETDRTSFGGSHHDALIDVIVHGQDLARPLGKPRTTAPLRTVTALEHALASRWYGARERLGHARLTATDIDWSGGSGTQPIAATSIDLLLVATGRAVHHSALAGEGVRPQMSEARSRRA